MEPILLKVSKLSKSQAVAGAIAGFVRKGKSVVVQAIGAEATYRASGAVALANEYVQENGLELHTKILLEDLGEEYYISATRFVILPRAVVRDVTSTPDYVAPVIYVSQEVYEGLCQLSAVQPNLFAPGVAAGMAKQMGYEATSEWISAHFAEYIIGVLNSFAPEGV